MKRLTAILALIILLIPVPMALSADSLRSELDRRWKRVEAVQKRQNETFRRLEREADRAMEPLNRAWNDGSRPD